MDFKARRTWYTKYYVPEREREEDDYEGKGADQD